MRRLWFSLLAEIFTSAALAGVIRPSPTTIEFRDKPGMSMEVQLTLIRIKIPMAQYIFNPDTKTVRVGGSVAFDMRSLTQPLQEELFFALTQVLRGEAPVAGVYYDFSAAEVQILKSPEARNYLEDVLRDPRRSRIAFDPSHDAYQVRRLLIVYPGNDFRLLASLRSIVEAKTLWTGPSGTVFDFKNATVQFTEAPTFTQRLDGSFNVFGRWVGFGGRLPQETPVSSHGTATPVQDLQQSLCSLVLQSPNEAEFP